MKEQRSEWKSCQKIDAQKMMLRLWLDDSATFCHGCTFNVGFQAVPVEWLLLMRQPVSLKARDLQVFCFYQVRGMGDGTNIG